MRRTAVRSSPSPAGRGRRRGGARVGLREDGQAVAHLGRHQPAVVLEVGVHEVPPERDDGLGVLVALPGEGLVRAEPGDQAALLAAVEVAEHQRVDADGVGAVPEGLRAPAELGGRHGGRGAAQDVGGVLEVAVAAHHQPRRHVEEGRHQVGRVAGEEEVPGARSVAGDQRAELAAVTGVGPSRRRGRGRSPRRPRAPRRSRRSPSDHGPHELRLARGRVPADYTVTPAAWAPSMTCRIASSTLSSTTE